MKGVFRAFCLHWNGWIAFISSLSMGKSEFQEWVNSGIGICLASISWDQRSILVQGFDSVNLGLSSNSHNMTN